ncbi:MAG: FAD-dependent oxidoreductase [Treponema sp.]|jgi:hypothetical protein|nr:FAD-dependent oxidoreductase [Treponema sp.]
MDKILFSQEVPVMDKVDVLVVGGGPAGIAASVAAARAGMSTRLVDNNGYLGGMATAGLVGPFMTSFSPDGSRQIVKGIFDELLLRMIDHGGAIHPSQCKPGTSYSSYIGRGHGNVSPFNSEAFKVDAEALCLNAGVKLLYHVFFVKALVSEDGDSITGAVFATKAGLQVIQAKIFIDCTGDGDLAASAGVVMKQGRDEDGLTQPATLFFRISGIDKQKLERHRLEHPEPDAKQFNTEVEYARSQGDFPIEREKLGMYESCDGTWRVNTTRIIHLDATDPAAVTAAEIEGRKQIQTVMSFLHKYIPGAENACLIESASVLGVRESRRIIGEYVLTAEDILSSRKFEDSIGLYGFPIDIHQPDGKSGVFMQFKEPYSIPYRILLPKQRGKNLLVAGRCVSATHDALGSVRIMPACFVTGQAAGTAAALALQEGISPKQLAYKKLEKKLLKNGALLTW